MSIVDSQYIQTEITPKAGYRISLSTIQQTAIDLYDRGLNVIPLPRPQEVEAYYGEATNNKPAYIKKPFYTSRLHFCTPECFRRNPSGCLPREQRMEALFDGANIGVMTGRTSGNLFALDCDSLRTYQLVQSALDNLGLSYWQYESYRGGVFLMRLLEGEVKNGKGYLPDLDIIGNLNYVVLPPSIHPSGLLYRWIVPPSQDNNGPPIISISQVEQFDVKLKNSQYSEPELFGLPEVCISLSKSNRKHLAFGTGEGNRNNATWAVACDLSGNGIDYNLARDLLLQMGNMCNPPYPEREVLDRLNRAYRGDYEPAKKTKKAHDYLHAESFMNSYDWRQHGRIRLTLQAVFKACIQRSRVEGHQFRASCREVAELAGCTKDTAADKLRMLVDIGLLIDIPNSPNALSNAKVYKFSDFVLATISKKREKKEEKNLSLSTTTACSSFFSGGIHYDIIPPCSSSVINSNHQKHDISSSIYQNVFYRHKVAEIIYAHLLTTSEPSKAAISRATNQPNSSTRKAVDWLVDYGLVIFNNAEGVYLSEPKTAQELAHIAARRGTLDKSERRKRHHQYERERNINRQVARSRAYWRHKTRY